MSVPRETVAAIATAQGKGALAVLRISGPGAFRICGLCLLQEAKFIGAADRTVGLYQCIDPENGKFIDTVCAVKYGCPKSYTGEDMVEITCHGGEVVPSLVLRSICHAGAVIAPPGEFTRRAIDAGKMDAATAEAILAIVDSTTEEEHARAISYQSGAAIQRISALIARCDVLAAEVAAAIETNEETGMSREQIRSEIEKIYQEISLELDSWKKGKRPDRKVVIAGICNAGKSTLFNLLSGSDRMLVDSKPGTTRDYVDERIRVADRWMCLVDTAGFEGDESAIGISSINRSWEQIDKADYVIWVSPLNLPACTEDEMRLIEKLHDRPFFIVHSKADIAVSGTREKKAAATGMRTCKCNLLEERECCQLKDALFSELMSKERTEREGTELIMNSRQEKVISEVLDEARLVLDDENAGIDVLADGIRKMAEKFRGLDTRNGGRELLTRILSGFCVGK